MSFKHQLLGTAITRHDKQYLAIRLSVADLVNPMQPLTLPDPSQPAPIDAERVAYFQTEHSANNAILVNLPPTSGILPGPHDNTFVISFPVGERLLVRSGLHRIAAMHKIAPSTVLDVLAEIE